MTSLDWNIVLIYFLFVLVLGVWISRGVTRVRDYFLAGRNIGVWAVAISVIATETSAATVIGGPDTSFRGDLAYLQTTIGAVISRFVLAFFVLDVYYRHDVYTVYGYLAKRFNRSVQSASALLFCVGRLFASGARLYIASFAAASIAGTDLFTTTLVIGAVALIYGALGGLRAVVATDILQGILFLGAGLYSLFILVRGSGGPSVLWANAAAEGKLRLFDFNFNLFSLEFWQNPYTFLGAVLGGFTLGMATHGTDQDMVQRMLACKSSREGRRSLIIAGLLEIPVTLLFVGIGVALWAYYQQAGAIAPSAGESVFPYFITHSLPSGMRGLLLAAILAAAMSSLDSAFTALSSVSVMDVYLPFRGKDVDVDGPGVIRLSRFLSLGWGLALIAAALFLGGVHQNLLHGSDAALDAARNKELLSLALGVMSVLYGPLLGVFAVGMGTRRGSTQSILTGMFLGLLSTSVLKYAAPNYVGWTWHVVFGFLITFIVGIMGRSDRP